MIVESDPLVGRELAGYRLESVLGRGGMGVVYLATDLRLERRVALKLVAPELAAEPGFRQRFLREAQLAAALDHSHIVPVHAAGETDGQLWIAMRYVQGEDLATVLRREAPLEPARALELVGQVGEALDAAHAHGLVHRDVKPANVLVTNEGGREHCYLTDFGLARSPDDNHDDTGRPHLSGTVDYVAPEQIAGEPADARADVYALGCLLYECLAGAPPFRRDRPSATLFAHVQEPPASLREQHPELPAAIDEVCARALAKLPGERYETCGQLCDAAREALGIGTPRFTRRQLLLAGTGAAVAIAAAVAVPVVLLGSDGDTTTAARARILPLPADGVVRIDPATGTVSEAIALGSTADAVAVGGGSVWVVNAREQRLSRIDPATNAVTSEVDVSRTGSPGFVAAGAAAVWLGRDIFGGKLWRYDTRSGALSPLPDVGTPTGAVVGLDAVWISTSDSRIVGIRPATGEVVSTTDLRQLAGCSCPSGSIATGEGSVWFAGGGGVGVDTVFRLDPESGLVAAIDVGAAVSDIAAGVGAGWVATLDSDELVRIDLGSNDVGEAISVGRSPSSVAAGAGFVWAASSRDGTLTRVDPVTFDLKTIDVGGVPTDVAVGAGAVWATVSVR